MRGTLIPSLRKRGRGDLNNPMKLAFLIAIYLVLSTTIALAYVDPNTGGYIFQLLYPVFMAIGIGSYFLKNQIKKLWHSFINLSGTSKYRKSVTLWNSTSG